MSGKPLRFFGIAMAGWVAVRMVMLWPAAVPSAIPHALAPAAFAEAASISPNTSLDAVLPASVVRSVSMSDMPSGHRSTAVTAMPIASGAGRQTPVQPIWTATLPLPEPPVRHPLLAPSPAIPLAASPPSDRWSASAWLVLRDGRGIAPGLGDGQLGGGQAGLRIAYSIGDARRVAIVARIASPLEGKGREAALGAEWRPTKLPVRLVAEYRVVLDSSGSGPAAGIVAGTGPAPLALGFDLETYGQAGVIRHRRTEPFAEGAARLSRPIVKLGKAKIDVGLGTWGGAQRGAQRLDIGPSLGVRLPVVGKSLRLSLDWRQRIAGGARPGSGPVLVIGSDF